MSLAQSSPSAAPEFADVAACKAWLAHLPLANVPAAQQQLRVQIEHFNRFAAEPATRLAVLEVLREPVHFVQVEQAKRFTNRALPMTEAEAAAFDETNRLWEAMRAGYLLCLEAAAPGAPSAGEAAVRGQAGRAAQRTLAYLALKMLDHYRAYRQAPAADWRALHQAYAHAEALEVAGQPVKDVMNRDVHDSSPRAAYGRAVLLGMANPNELGQRPLNFIAYVLERWGDKLEVSKQPVDEGEPLPPLVADLDSERCPERAESPSAVAANPRYLDTSKLAKSLRNRVALLRKGESPAKLGLGEDCVQPACEQLLVYLYRQWCKPKPARSTERRPVADKAQASTGISAIHYFITGNAFRQPVEQKGELSDKEAEQIATLGHVSTRARDELEYTTIRGFAIETWHLEDDSLQGLRMVRRAAEPGKRYAHGQLVGVRPADSKSFMLGQVRWLMVAENGDLHAGVKLLPGVPTAVAVRPTGLNVQAEKYVAGLTLGEVAALNSPASLVLPSGWFKPKRVIEIFTESARRVRLTDVIDRGTDFERVAYEQVE